MRALSLGGVCSLALLCRAGTGVPAPAAETCSFPAIPWSVQAEQGFSLSSVGPPGLESGASALVTTLVLELSAAAESCLKFGPLFTTSGGLLYLYKRVNRSRRVRVSAVSEGRRRPGGAGAPRRAARRTQSPAPALDVLSTLPPDDVREEARRSHHRASHALHPPVPTAFPTDWRLAVREEDVQTLEEALNSSGGGWEPVLERSSDELGVSYSSWKRPGRVASGVSEWRSVTRYQGVSAESLAAFQLDAARRHEWDGGVQLFSDFSEPSPEPVSPVALHFWRIKFPSPLAPRDYVITRRVWRQEAADGPEVRVISRALAPHSLPPSLELPGGRAHRVERYFSGVRMRPVPGGSELSTLYYEDNGLSAGMVDMVVKRGLWGFVEKQAQALRTYTPSVVGQAGAPAGGEPPSSEPRRGLRAALRGAGGMVATVAGAGLRGVVAGLRAAPSPAQQAARRRATRDAARRLPQPLERLATIAEPLRSAIHPVESLQRRGAAALGAAAAHEEREKARRAAREQERRRRAALADGQPRPQGGRLIMLAAASLAVRAVRTLREAKRQQAAMMEAR